MRAQPLLEPRPVPHYRLRTEEADRLAISGDGGPRSRVCDVKYGQLGPPPVDLGHGYMRCVGADDQALGTDSIEMQKCRL